MKKLIHIAIIFGLMLALVGCQTLDVVGNTAITTFESVSKDRVSFDQELESWALTSPEGERFLWNQDFSVSESDFILEFDAVPFIEAGLDPSKLDSKRFEYNEATKQLRVHFDIGNDKLTNNASPDSMDVFKSIVKQYRDVIGYHEKLDHYGVKLGDGNMFEWAKDTNTNDLDIVFVLEPEVFISAGVDPSKISGWNYAEVEMTNEQSKDVLVYKLLKAYNLD